MPGTSGTSAGPAQAPRPTHDEEQAQQAAFSLDTVEAAEYGGVETEQRSARRQVRSHVILRGYAGRVTFFISRGRPWPRSFRFARSGTTRTASRTSRRW